MKLEDVFNRIVEIESQRDPTQFIWRSFDIWPLIRQCLWFELNTVSQRRSRARSSVLQKSLQKGAFDEIRAFLSDLSQCYINNGVESTAFISRPVYLQRLPNGTWFDRILDPLVFSLESNINYSKYYLVPWLKTSNLLYEANLLRPLPSLCPAPIEDLRSVLTELALDAGIDPNQFLRHVSIKLTKFYKWYRFGTLFFGLRKNLKVIYLTGWYFPDSMGLIAAARERNVKVVDVQHGKQGPLQAMFSGWYIPKNGYQMLPDIFWCWGNPSANNILESSPNRFHHRPIVGGFPWIDYYCQYIREQTASEQNLHEKLVLVTIQPPQGDNTQPIPDFLLDYLSEVPKDIHFIFRCHPNDRISPEYCKRRLSKISPSLYEIDDGSSNLYDSLLIASHHITAFSSCCYEASVFDVPTLLFGADALKIYSDEIKKGLFDWANGSVEELVLWLSKNKFDVVHDENRYIVSSLDHARNVLAKIEREFTSVSP